MCVLPAVRQVTTESHFIKIAGHVNAMLVQSVKFNNQVLIIKITQIISPQPQLVCKRRYPGASLPQCDLARLLASTSLLKRNIYVT